MIKQMNYDSKFIDLMTELAAINPQLIFKLLKRLKSQSATCSMHRRTHSALKANLWQ